MRFFTALFFIFAILCAVASDVHAAYVGNPSRVFSAKDNSKIYSLFAEGVSDIVYDRGAKFQSDDMKVDFYGAVAGLILKNTCFFYGGLGGASVQEEYVIRGENVKWQTDYGLTWLAGATFKVYKRELELFGNSVLIVGLDGQYRNTDIESSSINISASEYDIPHTDISYSSIEYNDWHLALSCALTVGMLSPYVGMKYSDFESCPRVMRDSLVYQKDNAEADDNFGFFGGLSVSILDSLNANIEAGFIDEESISASFSLKF